jgi:hypothetical protein
MNNHPIFAMIEGAYSGMVAPDLLRRVVDLVDKHMACRWFAIGIRWPLGKKCPRI